MKGTAVFIGILALSAGMMLALSSEEAWLEAAALLAFFAALAGGAIASRDMREELADRFGPVAWIARGGFRLRPGPIAVTVAGVAIALAAAELIGRETRPGGELADHVERLESRLAELPPIRAAQLLEREWPAEDQRYTPWGVFLRYEEEVVALLARTAGSAVERLPAEDAYVEYGAIVGRFWGPAYQRRPRLRDSAMPVPSEDDLRVAARALAAAERAHRTCYGWDVEVRSGVRKGRLWGSGAGVGTRIDAECSHSAVLEGYIDPRAGRFRRGGPGEWSLHVRHQLVGDFPQASFEALSIPFVELLEGATTEPSDGGAIPGKGLLEHIGALPLLAQEADALGTVPLPEPRRPRGALAEVERSDAERRSEETAGGLAATLLRVGAGFAGFFLVVSLLAGLVARVVALARR